MLEFDPAIVLAGCGATSREQVIHSLVNAMEDAGYVTAAYLDNVLARENRYPTGLPTEGMHVAIPHGMNGDGILKPGVGVAQLCAPVSFRNMADPEEELGVELIFLLANREADAQLADLRDLMECFCEEELLYRLRQAQSAQELADLLTNACSANACRTD